MSSAFCDVTKDKAWDYLNPYPNTKDYIWMKPLTTTCSNASSYPVSRTAQSQIQPTRWGPFTPGTSPSPTLRCRIGGS
jgi:hypothetical protein